MPDVQEIIERDRELCAGIGTQHCPNGPDPETGDWPCDPKGYFGVLECQTCGYQAGVPDPRWGERDEHRIEHFPALVTEIEGLNGPDGRVALAQADLKVARAHIEEQAKEIERLRRLLRNGLRTMDGGVWVPAYRNEARAYFAALNVEAPDDETT